MKKLLDLALLFLLCIACENRKTVSLPQKASQHADDSAQIIGASEEEITEEVNDSMVVRHNVDEFFGDFIFDFVQNSELQKERVRFPLPLVQMNDNRKVTTLVNAREWKHERIFVSSEYYTVFFNDESQFDLENNTDIVQVDIERIDLRQQSVRVFHFEKSGGIWMLCREEERDMSSDILEDFYLFYYQFVTDSLFQRNAVEEPLRFVTADPDDDLTTIEGTLSVDQWFAFRPVLPEMVLTNIRYGQTYDNKKKIILVKRGMSNGMLDTFTFVKRNGVWKFISYEN